MLGSASRDYQSLGFMELMTMNSIRRISLAAALLAGSALAASPSLAQNQGFHPDGHPAAHPHPPAGAPMHRPVSPGTYRMIRPGMGFHRGPTPGFHRGPGVVARVHPFHSIIARHVPFARFTPAQRALWAKGHWYHRWWHGRYGWWWNASGAWFWYDAPVYPYPSVVSDYYYEEPDTEAGPTWWYCYNPAGYYPYVPSCSTQWTPVPAQGYGPGYGEEQSGPEQGPPPGNAYNEQGPPPSSGYGQEQGPPSGYDQGPPPGYDQGPPPGYDQGPPSGDQGPPPDDSQYPQNGH
jgi:hypothetical protein